MRLRTHPRAERLLVRLPRPTVYSAAELVLLALIAVQAARLVWTVAAPPSPIGDWKGAAAPALAGDGAVLAEFDPFFRLSAGGPVAVTSLNLKLYGVREDRATGRGSAIIALPDGSQQSFAVGDEVMPGVRLAEVGFDSVTIERGGAREQIFLDQSEPAEAAAPGEAPPAAQAEPPPPQAAAPAPAPAASPGDVVRLEPRMSGGRLDGIVVRPGADGGRAMNAAGLEAGDVIVSVNGRPVTSMEQARAAMRASGGQANVIVDRGGRAVPVRLRLGQ